ncbi:hypothetical protein BZA05DRAFT_205312 [Tricharina praecox]|uniref:uncharacterized protein n=1 Tax=Tricharina praecox TaxID=43433 RepID=UPI00221F55C3|nr:uncharacterized protein BZA05DRAFT_205312 [Tricharina praecox]KAI5842290.1 hypothetical protein BZA05DRAFT_205312 [Tricharina praecox]
MQSRRQPASRLRASAPLLHVCRVLYTAITMLPLLEFSSNRVTVTSLCSLVSKHSGSLLGGLPLLHPLLPIPRSLTSLPGLPASIPLPALLVLVLDLFRLPLQAGAIGTLHSHSERETEARLGRQRLKETETQTETEQEEERSLPTALVLTFESSHRPKPPPTPLCHSKSPLPSISIITYSTYLLLCALRSPANQPLWRICLSRLKSR